MMTDITATIVVIVDVAYDGTIATQFRMHK
jgi:hypothetical protein